MTINLNEFTPLSAVFEARYASQFLIWDRSGALWTGIAGTFPAISTKQAEPNQVLVRLAPNVDAAVGAEGFDEHIAYAGAIFGAAHGANERAVNVETYQECQPTLPPLLWTTS